MDCLNAQKASDPALLGQHQSASFHPAPPRRTRGLAAAVGVLGAFSVILLALIIWLAVEVQNNKHEIKQLRSMQLQAVTNTAQSAVVQTTNTGSNATIIDAAYPAVYLSQNATGQSGYQFAGSLYRGSGYWAAQPDLPTPRADFAAINANETLYILGGHDASENYLSSGFSYNPVLNLTGNVSSMPAARSHFTAGTIDNATIYVIGGYSSEANESSSSPENCSLAYDIADDSWTSGACLVQGRGAACGAVVDGQLFVAVGLGAGGQALSSVEIFHPSNNSWTTFAQLPYARSNAGCAASGNKLIIAGGINGTNGADLAEVWAVDSSSGTTTRLADMLYPGFDLQLVAIPGSSDVLAVGGGQHLNGTKDGLHYVERYSSASNQWVEKALLSNQRFAFGAAYINEGVYAIGGLIYCNDTLSDDCGARVLDSTEILYDASHPDVFIYTLQPGVEVNGQGPNASQVLLLSSTAEVNGYSSAGSLYQGSGYWGVGQDLPQALSDLNVVGYGNVAFIVGGLDLGANAAVNTLYKYDPVLDEYTNMSSLPEPRTRGAADILGDKLYYVAGFNSGADSAEPLDTMLIYDIPTDTWTESTATLSSPRSDLCMAAVGGVLYAAGGYSTNYTAILNLAEMFDPDTNTWTKITAMPTPGGDVMCAALNGQFVVAGGYYDPTLQFVPAAFRNEVQAYNPSTGDWTSLASLPVARGDAAMTAVPSQYGDRLIMMGGETQYDDLHTGVATHQVQEYSSTLDEWTLKAPMITPRFRHDCTYAEGHVITFGGASSSICADDDSGLEVCNLRPVAGSEEFFDTDNPDIFVYTAM